jgi:Fic family protein
MSVLEVVMKSVEKKKQELTDLSLAMNLGGLDNLDNAHRIEITYTSNALEGNTLSAGETALVIEQGITIGGKPLKDHLEAIDHSQALNWVFDLSQQNKIPISQIDIRNLHKLVMAQSKPDIAGRYADRARFTNTDEGEYLFPSPVEVVPLMDDFAFWLETAPNMPDLAFEAHRRLVAIHPFNDGNGRTARLLMNLILLRGGYRAIAIRPSDRVAYIATLEVGHSIKNYNEFNLLLYKILERTLDLYILAAKQAQYVNQISPKTLLDK